MSRVCKNCGAENRDLAQFCNGCGVPLPKITKADEKKIQEMEQKAKKFWNMVFAGAAVACVALFCIFSYIGENRKKQTVKQFADAYIYTDRNVFAGIAAKPFSLLGLTWGMPTSEIMKAFPGSTNERDPDFRGTLMVKTVAEGFKNYNGTGGKVPHASFMNLGIYLDKLYAIKFEFSETPEPLSQMIKVPDKEFRLYGRYLGVYRVFTELLGSPKMVFDQYKEGDLVKKVIGVTRGSSSGTTKNNIFIYWENGDTRTEIAVFGIKNARNEDELKFTVRFFYLPVYQRLAQQ